MITKKELRKYREMCELWGGSDDIGQEATVALPKLLDEVYRLRRRVSKLKAMNKKANTTIRWFMSKFGWEYYQKWGR